MILGEALCLSSPCSPYRRSRQDSTVTRPINDPAADPASTYVASHYLTACDCAATNPERSVPRKRKTVEQPDAVALSERDQSADEYASGKVSCDACGESVAWRHPETGKLQIEVWNEHRRAWLVESSHFGRIPLLMLPTSSGNAASVSDDADAEADEDLDAEGSPDVALTELPPVTAPDAPANRSEPPTKRRRAKRTEDERIEYLRTDPYVAQFEPYRVLCGACDKWIRLRPNSTYCSIPWDAHRKSCLAKKGCVRRACSVRPVPCYRKFVGSRVAESAYSPTLELLRSPAILL